MTDRAFLCWLRTLATDCTASGAAWWQTFPVYRSHDSRRVVLRWEPAPDERGRVYTSTLLEACRYAHILENDSSMTTRADLAREMGVSRARVTQIINLLRLAPEVQERLLGLQDQIRPGDGVPGRRADRSALT